MSLCALLVGVLGGGYLHALELMPCWLVGGWWFVLVGSGYLHAFVVRALVVGAGWKWLPACLEPFALLVGVVGSWVVTCMPWSLCFAGWYVLVCLGGSCWLEVVTCMP